MIAEYLQPLLDWLSQHPAQAGIAVFFIALLESAAIIGLFMPGTIIMFGIGAIVATGSLELAPTLMWATLGAIAGDGMSFFLGRHLHQRLRVIWPFRNYPGLVNRGVAFFHDHGGKSVFLARFLGPLRPIVPAVAGMLNMPPIRFFALDITSAILWAPAYILPGVLFGASMGLAAQIAGRLVMLLLVLILILWFAIWLVRRSLRYFQPRAASNINRALEWSRSHPHIQPLAGALLDPDHPEWRGLTILGLILLSASLLFAIVFSAVVYSPLLANLDQLVYHFLQSLRSPWADHLMVRITQLGDTVYLVGFLTCSSIWLLYRKRWSALQHWWVLVISVWLSTHALKLALRVPRPADAVANVPYFAFPSGHASMSVAIYGFLAVLIAGRIRTTLSWAPYTLAAGIIISIGFSRLYLGVHWLSDVLGGLTLGFAWVALFGIAYRRHPRPGLKLKGLLATLIIAVVIPGSLYSNYRLNSDLARYVREPLVQTLSAENWWQNEWRRVRTYRDDLESSKGQPLNLQWSGSLELLKSRLLAEGWREPVRLNFESASKWILPDQNADQLPVLPQFHAGHHDKLRLIRVLDNHSLLAIRLWPSAFTIRELNAPLWVGTVTIMQVKPAFRLLNILKTLALYDKPTKQIEDHLRSLTSRTVTREPTDEDTEREKDFDWNNEVLLLAPPDFSAR